MCENAAAPAVDSIRRIWFDGTVFSDFPRYGSPELAVMES
jgi:hypothetical protein